MALPKPGGGGRKLGIPPVLDRFLPQALLHVLPPAWDKTCAAGRDGVRPGRSAHQAIARAQAYLEEGYRWVVDLDREKFFDRVPQDQVLRVGNARGKDRRVVRLIDRGLQAGALTGEGFAATTDGTPQGGPWSPLFANLLLDGFAKELERRGHRFVRDADESTIDVKSARAGYRVLASVRRF